MPAARFAPKLVMTDRLLCQYEALRRSDLVSMNEYKVVHQLAVDLEYDELAVASSMPQCYSDLLINYKEPTEEVFSKFMEGE